MRFYKITILNADDTYYNSVKFFTFKGLTEALEIFMKPSIFGNANFKIIVETYWIEEEK
mgnify:CR=1 FL=1